MGHGEKIHPLPADDESLVRYIEKRERNYAATSADSALLSKQNRDGVRAAVESAQYPVDESPEVGLGRKQLSALMASAISTLTKQEQMVLKMRYVGDKTLEQAASVLDVQPQTIRNIEARAIRKLGISPQADAMRAFAEENNSTAIPEKLTIKVPDRGERVLTDVSKEYFETEVMKMFDKEKKTSRQIADELGCKQIFVKYALNEKLRERYRAQKAEAAERRHKAKIPGRMEQ